MGESIRTEWGDPNNEGVPWESREGGWQLGPVLDTWDLVDDEIGYVFVSTDLQDDFIESFSQRQWCQRDFYGLRRDRGLEYGWKAFVDYVQHRGRYFFMNRRSQPQEEWPFNNDIKPEDMLGELGRIIDELELVTPIAPGTTIYRGRQHDAKTCIAHANDLGPPPPERAQANRMSPPGVPMFYGALDTDTVHAEVFDARYSHSPISVGGFVTAREFYVVDFSKFPGVPSLFDEARRHLRAPSLFLRDFVREVSRPLERDGSEHVEYVPTQIVTEYLRDVWDDESGRVIRGMLFGSSKTKGGVCCVLFFEQSCCVDLCEGWDSNDEAWLGLDTASIRTDVYKG